MLNFSLNEEEKAVRMEKISITVKASQILT